MRSIGRAAAARPVMRAFVRAYRRAGPTAGRGAASTQVTHTRARSPLFSCAHGPRHPGAAIDGPVRTQRPPSVPLVLLLTAERTRRRSAGGRGAPRPGAEQTGVPRGTDERVASAVAARRVEMFGCIVAGRLVQTEPRQVDHNKFTFTIDHALAANHFVVFLLGTVVRCRGSTRHGTGPGAPSPTAAHSHSQMALVGPFTCAGHRTSRPGTSSATSVTTNRQLCFGFCPSQLRSRRPQIPLQWWRPVTRSLTSASRSTR